MSSRMRTFEHNRKPYLPAAGHNWFLPLYDPLVRLLGGEPARRELLNQADVRPRQRILDIGCGTGTFAVLIKRLHPQVEVLGLDPDSKALARARAKADRAGVSVHLDQGYSDELPYEDNSFNRVFSSFMFHHLEDADKEKTLREVKRVLKPDGSLHLLDFAGTDSDRGGLLGRLIHSSNHLKDNTETQIVGLMKRTGFSGAQKVADGRMLFGLLRTAYFRALAP